MKWYEKEKSPEEVGVVYIPGTSDSAANREAGRARKRAVRDQLTFETRVTQVIIFGIFIVGIVIGKFCL